MSHLLQRQPVEEHLLSLLCHLLNHHFCLHHLKLIPYVSFNPSVQKIQIKTLIFLLVSGAGSGGSTRHSISDRAQPVPTSTTSTTAAATASSNSATGGDQSGSLGRKIEFSSSFDKYKSSPTSRTTLGDSPSSTSMMRRWSRTSDQSSILWRNEYDQENDDLQDFVHLVKKGSKQELRLFQQPSRSTLLSSASDSSSNSSMMMNSASVSKKAALSHFQNLRETHNSLSDSLSSSMLMGNAASSQQHEPVTGISPVSSTSSTGRSYQPIIPSPLHHTEQRSTSPVHIPRSYPQLTSITHTQNAVRIARINTSSRSINDPGDNENEQEEEEDIESMLYAARARDISAYSTYPQDRHHLLHHHLRHQQDLDHALRDAHTTGHSGYTTGAKAAGTPTTGQTKQLPQSRQQQAKSPSRSSDSHDLYRSRDTTGGEGSSSLMMDPSGSSVGAGGTSSNRGNNSSLMDDDDSLVFKMSELECEGPSSSSTSSGKQPLQKHEMLFNNRLHGNNNTHLLNLTNSAPTSPHTTTAANNRVNEHYLELTPTPLSSPLLHRLQAASMSTVAEEEEKSSLSASGSSNKSDSHHTAPTSGTGGVIKPSPLPFDSW
jgi:hypothetical protein